MQEKRLWVCFVLWSFTITAQINGIVKDSISGNPIPFVSIWLENEKNSTATEENGTFVLSKKEMGNYAYFSILGYAKKRVLLLEKNTVLLNPIPFQLEDVVVNNRMLTKEIEIGKTKNEFFQAFENGPKIDIKYFPYSAEYKKTRYLKEVTLFTDSRIENTTLKLHFFKVDSEGLPAEEMLTKDFIVTLKKGVYKHHFKVLDYNLLIPKTGIFIGFEKILIEKNSIIKISQDPNTKEMISQKSYSPFVLYKYTESDYQFVFKNGKWIKNIAEKNNRLMVYEPSIHLILTN